MKNKIYLLTTLFCIILCSACAYTNVPVTSVYTITNTTTADTINSKKNWGSSKHLQTLKLAAIRSIQPFTSTKIIYSDNQYSRNSYLYSHWSDAPVTLLQQLLQSALEQNNQLISILPTNSSATTNLLLESTLYDFSHHINTDQTSFGVIRIHFYLIDNLKKSLISSREFIATVAAPTCDASGGATALNLATQQIISDLNTWLKSQLNCNTTSLRDQ